MSKQSLKHNTGLILTTQRFVHKKTFEEIRRKKGRLWK